MEYVNNLTENDVKLMAKLAKPLQDFITIKVVPDSVIILDTNNVKFMGSIMCARKEMPKKLSV